MFRTILVPLDGAPFGEHAVPLAASIARRTGAALHFVYVHVPQEIAFGEPVLFTPPGVDEAVKTERLKYLEELARRTTPGLKAAPFCTVLQGAVAPTLEKHALSINADLVVMTTHGRGPISRAWFGSVADDLMRRLIFPVLLVRPEAHAADVTAEVPLKRLLIALDGSPLSEQILAPAGELAWVFQAECTLVRVLPPLVRGQGDVVDVALSQLDTELLEKLKALHQQDRDAAVKYLETKAAELRGRVPKVQARLVDNDQPAAALLQEATTIAADLLAMATHGRGGIPRLFLGSIADKVTRGAHCSILVFRPKHA
jgi:nucleotide-binding universal stress UspA family protein